MASGMVLFPITSTVLVQGDGWAEARHDSTQALHAFRQTTVPAGALSGVLAAHSTLYGNLTGPGAPNGVALWQATQVVLVPNPEWDRQPDRTQLLFALRSQVQLITAVPKLPGPGVQPFGLNQFRSPPRSTAPASILAPISGILQSSSVLYGAMTPAPVLVGFIPQPGPGLAGPFNLNQFVLPPGDTSQSSVTAGPVSGLLGSSSVLYGVLTGAGALSGLQPSASTLYGSLLGIPAGTIGGLLVSSSTAYANLTAVANLSGLSVSASVVLSLGIGSGFQPLVPNTPVLDVRLGIGYAPWSVHKGGTIG